MPPLEHVQYLAGSAYRPEILATLCEQSLRPAELTDRIAVTRTTVHRILSGFTERHWVCKRDGAYRATVTGERVSAEYQSLVAEVERAEAYGPLATHADELSRRLAPEVFTETTVTVATPQRPLAPTDRYFEAIEGDFSRIRALTSNLTRIETAQQFLDAGTRLELIIDESTLDALRSEFPRTLDDWRREPHCSLYVSPTSIDYGLVIADDTVFVGGYGETGQFVILVEGTNAELTDSALVVFDECKATATALGNH